MFDVIFPKKQGRESAPLITNLYLSVTVAAVADFVPLPVSNPKAEDNFPGFRWNKCNPAGVIPDGGQNLPVPTNAAVSFSASVSDW
jgi:hypothetical protein